jgi:hypothetical protein
VALFGARARAKRRKHVERELESNPAWGVVAQRKWVCPYCAQLVLKLPEDLAQRVDAVLDHFDSGCAGYAGGNGSEVGLPELRRVASRRQLRSLVKQQLVRNPSWQLIDYTQRWFCAYCGEVTLVKVPRGRKMTEEALAGIVDHVERCYAYDHGRGKEKPFAHLKAIVKYQNQSRKLAENVRSKLEGDPLWRRKDPRHRWICPYCLAVQDHIDLSSNMQMFENAPTLIARHLAGACNAFREGGKPRPLGAQRSDVEAAPPVDADEDVFARGDRLEARRGGGDAAQLTGARPQTPIVSEPSDSVRVDASGPRLRPESDEGPIPVSGSYWGKDGDQILKARGNRGTTLRQLEESGEFLRVDDEASELLRGISGRQRRQPAPEVEPSRAEEGGARVGAFAARRPRALRGAGAPVGGRGADRRARARRVGPRTAPDRDGAEGAAGRLRRRAAPWAGAIGPLRRGGRDGGGRGAAHGGHGPERDPASRVPQALPE